MLNVETVSELLANPVQEGIVGTARTHEMRGQRGLAGTHGPDVEVVHVRHAVQTREIISNVGEFDILWHGVEREVDTVARQCPSARKITAAATTTPNETAASATICR